MVAHLAKFEYFPTPHTEGLFKHKTRDISFTLVVDDFGIKYKKEEDLEHLISSLKEKYEMTVDTKAKQYVGIALEWDYDKRELTCSMDEYVESALKEFQHAMPRQHHYGPSKMEARDYGAKVQYVKHDDTAPLNADQIKHIQRVVGKFLFLARAIDCTMLHALNEIACASTKGTQSTLAASKFRFQNPPSLLSSRSNICGTLLLKQLNLLKLKNLSFQALGSFALATQALNSRPDFLFQNPVLLFLANLLFSNTQWLVPLL